jgi:hypothetical protein
MQERPQLPSSRTLERKETTGSGRFHDLRDSATPLSGSIAVESEEVSVDSAHSAEPIEHDQKVEFVDLRDSATPLSGSMELDHEEVSVDTTRFHDLEYAATLLESMELDSEEVSVEKTQVHDLIEVVESENKEEVVDLHDAATPLNESVELDNEETIVEETQIHNRVETVEPEHKEEGVDLHHSEMEAKVKEFATPQNAKVSDAKSRKRKSRKNRNNGHQSEEVSDGQIRTSINNDANFPKNGKFHDLADKEANVPTGQASVLIDQTKE